VVVPARLGGSLEHREAGDFIGYPNVPRNIALVIGRKPALATLHELDTIYGVEDLHDMLEVMSVDALNQDVADLHARIEAKVAAMANRRR
jgi:uncharacterized small protein (DUF1192 family)